MAWIEMILIGEPICTLPCPPARANVVRALACTIRLMNSCTTEDKMNATIAVCTSCLTE